MRFIQIKHHHTDKVLFEGQFESLKEAVEQAAQDNVSLDYADLQHSSFLNANLDNVRMRHSRLKGSNFMGANLSESDLEGSDFSDASLQNACFCFSSLQDSNFSGSSFGATDIAGCDISRSLFSTVSAFHLNFTDTEVMKGCHYEDASGIKCPVSRPPVLVHGLSYPLVFMDRHIKLGSFLKTYDEWQVCMNDNSSAHQLQNGDIHGFLHKHRSLFKTFLLT